MKLTIIQVASPLDEDVSRRIARVGEMVRSAPESDLIVLPELWAPGYFDFENYAERAEHLDGPTVSAVRTWATELRTHIHLGSFLEAGKSGEIYNTSAVITPDGSVLGTYRKIHLFGYRSRESEILTAGKEVTVLPSPVGQLGITTCYDLRFPELWRALVDRDASIVATCAAWPEARSKHWQLFTECRAVEEQIVLIACNAVGTQGGVELAGRSRIVAPTGEVLFEAGRRESVDTIEVSDQLVAETRADFPVLRDRQL